MTKNTWIRRVKKILLAPLCLIGGAVEGVDREELKRILDKRVARAEAGVIRGYLSQKGVEGDELESAIDQLRRERQASVPTWETISSLERKASDLEYKLRETQTESSARLAMAKLGVSDEYAGDVLKLAEEGLKSAREQGGSSGEMEEFVTDAIEAVVARLPGLIGEGAGVGYSGGYTGRTGNYPRADVSGSMQQSLDHARQSGNNAAAVAIISQAAKKGIRLR